MMAYAILRFICQKKHNEITFFHNLAAQIYIYEITKDTITSHDIKQKDVVQDPAGQTD